jgi:hypothetical protein
MENISPEDFATMRQQVNEMYTALIGNKIAKDGGMAGRLTKVETRLESVEKVGARIAWHFKVMYVTVGFVAAGIWQLFTKK